MGLSSSTCDVCGKQLTSYLQDEEGKCYCSEECYEQTLPRCEICDISILVAIGVNQEGYREILGVCEGGREDSESWTAFLRNLKDRWLKGFRLVTSDKCLGLIEVLPNFFSEAKWQRCVVHFYRNVYGAVPRGKVREVTLMLKAIHSQEDLQAARKKAEDVVAKLKDMKLGKGYEETLSYFHFPSEHWGKIRINNVLERLNREIRRRTRGVGNFHDGKSALILVSARVRHVASTKWGQRSYMNMDLLREQDYSEEEKRQDTTAI